MQEKRPDQWKTDHKHGEHPPPDSQTPLLHSNDHHPNPNSSASKALSSWLLKTANYTKDILNNVIKIDNNATLKFLEEGHWILSKMDDVDDE